MFSNHLLDQDLSSKGLFIATAQCGECPANTTPTYSLSLWKLAGDKWHNDDDIHSHGELYYGSVGY